MSSVTGFPRVVPKQSVFYNEENKQLLFFLGAPPPSKETKKLDDNASQTRNTENPLVYSGKKCNKIDAVVTGPEPTCSCNVMTGLAVG
jgi:hypothetical protein